MSHIENQNQVDIPKDINLAHPRGVEGIFIQSLENELKTNQELARKLT